MHYRELQEKLDDIKNYANTLQQSHINLSERLYSMTGKQDPFGTR